MDEREELAHLRAPSTDPKQRQVDYWGRRAEKAEDEVARLRAALEDIADHGDMYNGPGLAAIAKLALEQSVPTTSEK